MAFLRFLAVIALLAAPALAEIYFVGQQTGSFVRKLQPHRSLFKYEPAGPLDNTVFKSEDTDTDTLVETDTDHDTDTDTETDVSVSGSPSMSVSSSVSISTSTSPSPSTSTSVSVSTSPSPSTTASSTASITRSRTSSRSFSSSPSPSNSPVNAGSVNECATQNGGCSAFATCRDVGNTVACKCIQRYDGDGRTCTAQPTCGGKVRLPGSSSDCAPEKVSAWKDGMAAYTGTSADTIDVNCDVFDTKASAVEYGFTIFITQASGSTVTLAQISSAMADTSSLVEAINTVLSEQGFPTVDASQVVVVVNPTPSPSPSPSPVVLAAKSSKSDDLSDGEIAAIVICSVIGAAAIVAAAVFIYSKRSGSKVQHRTAAAGSDPSQPGKFDRIQDRRM